jgi:16S rRNA (cytidine1402-2'-O)-methyltransferase
MKEVLGDRTVGVVREITKLYDETKKASVRELIEYYEKNPPKGEIVLVVEGAKNSALTSQAIESELRTLLKDHSLKDASTILAQAHGMERKSIYQLGLKIKD